MIKLTFEEATTQAEDRALAMAEHVYKVDKEDLLGDSDLAKYPGLTEERLESFMQNYKEKLLKTWVKSGVIVDVQGGSPANRFTP